MHKQAETASREPSWGLVRETNHALILQMLTLFIPCTNRARIEVNEFSMIARKELCWLHHNRGGCIPVCIIPSIGRRLYQQNGIAGS